MRIVEMEDRDAITIFETLGSETTYKLYRELQAEPQTPKELAEALDTSLQNVHYHLDKLEEASLIKTVDTWYSKKGIEMNVYAPTHSPLVISFADDSQQRQVRSTLSQTFVLIGIIAVVSMVIDLAVQRFVSFESAGDQGEEITPQSDPISSETDAPITIGLESVSPVTEFVLSAPGLTVFLLGTLLVGVYAVVQLRSVGKQWQ